MFTKSLLTRTIGALALLALALTACLPSALTPPSTGVVKGVVYADLNGNGNIDAGEGPLDGAQVTLADCGPSLIQITNVDGAFDFSNLPAGTCHVAVSKADWIYSGSYPSLTYPIPVASDPNLPTAFSIFMAPTNAVPPTDTPTPGSPTETPTPTSTNTPSAPMVSANGENVNCRYGPGGEWLAVGALNVGVTVPILGTDTTRNWWAIDNPRTPGTICWVSAAVTLTSGDTTTAPLLPLPVAMVTDLSVSISPGTTVHGSCGGPNPVSFAVTTTTNGPASVTYHLEIYNGDNSLRNKTDDAYLTFASVSTQTFDPGGAYKTDCGDYYIKVIVTSPNSVTAQANWSVVSP
jgi:hypothetical protein